MTSPFPWLCPGQLWRCEFPAFPSSTQCINFYPHLIPLMPFWLEPARELRHFKQKKSLFENIWLNVFIFSPWEDFFVLVWYFAIIFLFVCFHINCHFALYFLKINKTMFKVHLKNVILEIPVAKLKLFVKIDIFLQKYINVSLRLYFLWENCPNKRLQSVLFCSSFYLLSSKVI